MAQTNTGLVKFPGLDDKYVQEIESRTQNAPAAYKNILQQQMYSDYYNQQQKEKEQQERLATKNEITAKSFAAKGNDKASMQLQIKKGNLADVIRNYYGMSVSDGDDETVINNFVSQVKGGDKMYLDYLNGKNSDIMVSTGLFGDKRAEINKKNSVTAAAQGTVNSSATKIQNTQPTNFTSTSHFDDDEYAAYYLQNQDKEYDAFINAAKQEGYSDGTIASLIDAKKTYDDFVAQTEAYENRGLSEKIGVGGEVPAGILQGFTDFFVNAYNNTLGENPYVGIAPAIDTTKTQFTANVLGGGTYGQLRADSGWTKGGKVAGDLLANTAVMMLLPGMGAEGSIESVAESALKEGGRGVVKNLAQRTIYGAAEGAEFGALATLGQENPDTQNLLTNMGAGAALGGVIGTAGGGINAYKYRNVLKTALNDSKQASRVSELLDMYNRSVKPTSRGVKTNTQLQQYNDDALGAVETIIKNKDGLKYIDVNGEETFGHLPTTLDEFSQAIKQTKQSIFDQYNAIAQEAGQTVNVDTTNIRNELNKLLNNKEWKVGKDQGTISQVEKWVKDLDELGNSMSVEGAQQKVQELNQKLQAFLKSQNPNDVGTNAVDGLVLNGLKNSIDDAIEKAGLDSEEYIQLRNLYKQLKTIEGDVNQRAVVYGRQNPQSLIDSMADLQTIDAIADILQNPASGILKLAKTKGFKTLAKAKNDPNNNIKNMFNQADDFISRSETLKTPQQIAREKTAANERGIRRSRQERLQERQNLYNRQQENLRMAREKQAQQEAAYQEYLRLKKPDNPGLEYNAGFNGEPTTTITVTPEGQSVRQGQIAEKGVNNVNYVDNTNKTLAENISQDKITLTAEQIKKISNGQAPLDSDAAEQLVALHNLSKENLEKAANLGGFPMPSIAVTKKGVPHESYGDISIVFKKETVDPLANKANKLFSVDAYTATVPQPKYLPKGGKEAKEIISNIQKETGLSYGEVNQWIEFPAEYERIYPELKKYSDLHDKVADKKLFEGYTNAGSRRYKDYTLDNVVKNMKKDDGRTAFGNFGKLVGDERGKLKSLSDARNIDYKATNTESYGKLANEYNDAKRDVYNSITDEDSFLDFDVFNDIVESSFNKNDKKRLENINKELNGDFGYELSLDDVQKIHKPIQDGAKLQRPYAEAKPERPVKFDEVSYVLAPEEQAAEVEKLLGDKVKVVSYKPSEGRTSKLKELQKKYGNVFFGVGGTIFPISYLLYGDSTGGESIDNATRI